LKVTFNDCHNDLVARGGAEAGKAVRSWEARSGYAHVVDFVKGFTHEHLFRISSSEVRRVIEQSGHALGNIQNSEKLDIIEDFTAPFAFQHLFHWYIEHNKSVPTWKQFRDWMVLGPAAPHWHQLLKQRLEEVQPDGDRRAWSRAARWRLGKLYLSNIRELDLLARLREAGAPVKYHLLADVLLRVDFWAEDVAVCLYFPNSTFRDGAEVGRKPSAHRYLDGAAHPFKIVHVTIERQGFGNVWYASDKFVAGLADSIKEKMTR
jgi:hypothetical protein